MANLKDELINISSDIDSLLSIAEADSNITKEQLRSIDQLRYDVVDTMKYSSELTADKIEDLKYELSILQNDLSQSIERASILNYKGHELQSTAIKQAGTEQAESIFMHGIFALTGLTLGADILGRHLESGLVNGAKEISSALTNKNVISSDKSNEIDKLVPLLLNVTRFGNDSLSFKDITDKIHNKHDSNYHAEELQNLLIGLVADGLLVPEKGSDLSKYSINLEHDRVRNLLVEVLRESFKSINENR